MSKARIRAILFDLGDTLLNFGRVKTTRLFFQGAQYSYAYLKEHQQVCDSFYYYFLRNLIILRWNHFYANRVRRDFNSLDLLKTIGRRRGIELTDSQWEHFTGLWYQPLRQIATVEPDLGQTLERLRAAGVKLGIVSNTFVHGCVLDRHLEQLNLLHFFPIRLYSYQFSFRKPDVRIFQAGADRLGESLENIMYVGDRLDNDIAPALALGMQAVLKKAYTSIGKAIPAGAHHVDRISELTELVSSLNNTPLS